MTGKTENGLAKAMKLKRQMFKYIFRKTSPSAPHFSKTFKQEWKMGIPILYFYFYLFWVNFINFGTGIGEKLK